MATRDGARALGWENEIGSIEVGTKADLVALDLGTLTNTLPESSGPSRDRKSGKSNDEFDAIASAIVYSSSPRHVRSTWVDGRLLYRDGQVTTIAAAPLLARVRRAQALIARRTHAKVR
jgi:cytosine/adenosine deaminase-related metal-dependent hydrolase